ncbi:30S ribosomal protein S18 [Candidatus Parcubacteria bacterium]|nr:MAG: 30S ribosomal protein S18 [Candidatus Parcubacteria bacterium]
MKEQLQNEKACYFCVNNIDNIDYKDIHTISRFVNMYKKILPKRRTGTCSKHQRQLATAIKRARIMALLPFTNQ